MDEDNESATRPLNDSAADFVFKIDRGQAVEIARTQLTTAILRGSGWGSAPRLGDVLESDVVGYPFWVYYFERRRGRLDIKLLDAVTGRSPGPKTKATLLQAFVETS